MKKIYVSNYNEIKKIVENLNFETESQILFRGETNPLVPSIVRKCSFNSSGDLVIKEKLVNSFFEVL